MVSLISWKLPVRSGLKFFFPGFDRESSKEMLTEEIALKKSTRTLLWMFCFGLVLGLFSCSDNNGPTLGRTGGSGGGGGGGGSDGGGDNEIRFFQAAHVSPVTGIQTIVSRRGNMPTMEVSGLQAKGHVQLFSDATCTKAVSEKIPTFKPTQSLATMPLPADKEYSVYAKSWDKEGNASKCSTVFSSYTYKRAQMTRSVHTVSAGKEHACAIVQPLGTVKCWGKGNLGQLGNDATNDSNAPVNVVAAEGSTDALSGVSQISAGDTHTCALTSRGGVKCWGQEYFFSVFNLSPENGIIGANYERSAPVAIMSEAGSTIPLGNIVQVAAGGLHTCALASSGGVKCWGWGGGRGEAVEGENAFFNETVNDPVGIVAAEGSTDFLSGVVQIAAGYNHTCALMMGSGGVKCWGNGRYGQLGNGASGSENYHSAPVDVLAADGSTDLLSGVAQITAGDAFTCALMKSGTVKCWGQKYRGRLGSRYEHYADTANAPIDVISGRYNDNPLGGIAQVVAGDDHACARTTFGAIKCWGSNNGGQLGRNWSGGSASYPINLSSGQSGVPLYNAGQVAAGTDFNCFVSFGGIKCWGAGSAGQLGDGTNVSKNVPVSVISEAGSTTALSTGIQSSGTVFPILGLIDSTVSERPQFRVSYVKAGDEVSLHPDSFCAGEVLASGTVAAEAESIDLTISRPLVAINHTFYAKVGKSCISNAVSYTYNSGEARLQHFWGQFYVRFTKRGDLISLHQQDDCSDPAAIRKTVNIDREMFTFPIQKDKLKLARDGHTYILFLKQNATCHPNRWGFQF